MELTNINPPRITTEPELAHSFRFNMLVVFVVNKAVRKYEFLQPPSTCLHGIYLLLSILLVALFICMGFGKEKVSLVGR